MAGLGPLPGTDRQSELETESFLAFQAALPVEKFIFRDERTQDRGVDGSLELKVDGWATNFRAQVQIKGTDDAKCNANGSVSLPVRPSNLNYLLNGPCGLYILYVAPRDELRFLWAQDERGHLDRECPGWHEQAKVSVRFEKVLDTQTIAEIHGRILREMRMFRSMQDVFARATHTEQVVFEVDPDTRCVKDSVSAWEVVQKSGLALVAAGYPAQLLDYLRRLDRETAKHPRALLAGAYAHMVLGHYQTTLGECSAAALKRGQLTERDQDFLDRLRASCELQTGHISLLEYQKQVEERSRRIDGTGRLAEQLDFARRDLLAELDPKRRGEAAERIGELARQIVDAPDAGDALQLQARLCHLYSEGTMVAGEVINAFTKLKIQALSGLPMQRNEILGKLNGEWIRWEQQIASAVDDAQEMKHPLLLADALAVRGIVRTAYMFEKLVVARLGAALPDRPGLIEEALSDATRATEIYARAEVLEGELRAQLLRGYLHLLLNDPKAAKVIGEDVLARARAMAYTGLEELAAACIGGRNLLAERIDVLRNQSPEDKMADLSDEDLRDWADTVRQALGLPVDRLPAIVRGCEAERGLWREKGEWCEHIRLLPDPRHTLHHATYYLIDPDYTCRCGEYGHKSGIPSHRWGVVVSAFKNTYCANCPGRSPLQRSKV